MANPDEWAAWRSGVAQPGAPNVDWGDVGASAISGLQKVPAMIAGMPGDVERFVGGLGDWGAQQIGTALGATPQQMQAMQNDVNAMRNHTGAHAHDLQLPFAGLPPSSGDVNHFIEQHVTGPQHQPTTEGGRYAETIAEFAPMALAPGGPLLRAGRVVAPGVASEFAGEATQGTPAEPYARFAGGMAGGIALEGANHFMSAPDRIAATALQGATDADVQAAQALRQRAAAMGVDLTVAEALQQVTHGGTGMQTLQSGVESSLHGAPVMAPYMRNRPAQAAQAVENFANRVAPPTPEPSTIIPRAQNAASRALSDVNQNINQRTEHLYQSLHGQVIDPADWQTLMADPAFRRSFEQVRGNAELNRGLEGEPDHSQAVAMRVYQHLRDEAANTMPNAAAPQPGQSRFVASGRTGAAQQVRQAASPEFNQALDTQAQLRQSELEPLQRGPLGGVERGNTIQGQTGALFPAAPPAGGAQETAQAVQRLTAQDPQVASDLARQHVLGGRTGAQEQMQALSGGENQYGMSKWAANIAGNAEQSQALIAGFRALPGNGAQLANELADLIETGHATGRRTPRGSETASRTEMHEELGRAIPQINKLPSDFMRGQRVRALADFLTVHPDETAAAIQAARQRGTKFRLPLAEAVLGRPQTEGQQ